ncbi:FMN-binding protein [Bifidobacterium cebidarum]|uniref:FMN-binding domain-containing protein n=1 Tax=Bifidobacterium cebidarum TaxID=2650773 RepID=A0A6I1GAP7_9BIFI|nr:FMN-binding protein [Bifidobacterium cebidarum]KAB7786994.1 FMN-binding domain-containing protein [Bifidobacterium cebidarum]
MKTVTRAAIAAMAGLAIIADAFLLFVKPHLAQQDAATGSTLASGSTDASTSESSSSDQSHTSGTDSTDNSDSGTSNTDSTNDSGLTDGTYTGVATQNKYGEVQLQVTVSGGKITTITAVKAPSTGRSQQVNAQAIPALTERAISAQSSEIQFVSGATETSTAFVNSLQDAINQSLNAGK